MSNGDSTKVKQIEITSEEVDFIIQQTISDSSIKVLDYKLISPSGETLGLTTLHLFLKVIIQRPDQTQETLNYFVKSLPNNNNSAQTSLLTELGIFDKEGFFFNTIIPLFASKYDIHKWFPTSFLAKGNKIVLEDLKSQGYQICQTFFDNYEMLKSAVATLASFHSSSILADAHLNRGLEHPIPLNERFPKTASETIFSDAEFSKAWYNNGAIKACKIAEHIGKDPEKVRQMFNRLHDIVKPSKKHRNVILHSDLWKNNIMFDDSKPIPNSILVDFQTTRYGPMVLDLLQLLHLNSSPAYRAKFEKELVDHYHSVLEETVSRNDPGASIPTREEIDLGLQELRIFGILLSCLYFPVVMLDPKILTEYAKDEKGYQLLVGANGRTDFILNNFEKDVIYKTRVVEAITELIDFSE